MANYVRNYVYCCKELFDDFLYVDFNNRLFQNGMYRTQGYVLHDGRHLVTFETRGMEYCTEFINPIIEKYKDTTWYCVEENEVEEGSFQYERGKVCYCSRDLIQVIPDCLIEICYSDNAWITFRRLFINNQEAVIEDSVGNKVMRYKLSQRASEEIVSFAEEKRRGLFSKRTNQYATFPLPEEWPVWHDIYIYDKENYPELSVEFSNIEDDYIKEYWCDADTELGERYANEFLSQLQTIMDKHNVPVKTKFKRIIDMV